MELANVMSELEVLSTEQTRKIFKNHGAMEPIFGVNIKPLKSLAKKIKKDHALALALYATGNYDAQYLAGMIAEPARMSKTAIEQWMQTANCHIISDYIIAKTLAETDFAQELADRWINSKSNIHMAAGWNCYCQLLSTSPDSTFHKDKLNNMLQRVVTEIHSQPNWVTYAMNNFILSVGISYLPLHKEALQAAMQIGTVTVDHGKTNCKTPNAEAYIRKAAQKQKAIAPETTPPHPEYRNP